MDNGTSRTPLFLGTAAAGALPGAYLWSTLGPPGAIAWLPLFGPLFAFGLSGLAWQRLRRGRGSLFATLGALVLCLPVLVVPALRKKASATLVAGVMATLWFVPMLVFSWKVAEREANMELRLRVSNEVRRVVGTDTTLISDRRSRCAEAAEVCTEAGFESRTCLPNVCHEEHLVLEEELLAADRERSAEACARLVPRAERMGIYRVGAFCRSAARRTEPAPTPTAAADEASAEEAPDGTGECARYRACMCGLADQPGPLGATFRDACTAAHALERSTNAHVQEECARSRAGQRRIAQDLGMTPPEACRATGPAE